VCNDEDCPGASGAHLLAKERIIQSLEAKEEEKYRGCIVGVGFGDLQAATQD
jgi:hypothetical protein